MWTIDIIALWKLSSLRQKSFVFLSSIDEKASESLEFIENQYPQRELFELATSFMDVHHSDAIKATLEQFESLWYFPATEVEMEMNCAIEHALIGSYKSAFADLRRALELTLVGVYLVSDYSDKNRAIEWFRWKSDTPFFSNITRELVREWNFADLDKKLCWRNNIKFIYHSLSDYSHNKGGAKGYRNLNKINAYIGPSACMWVKLETLSMFCDFYIQIVQEIVVILSLYNPIILVGVPFSEKFWINWPASWFYEEAQAELVHKLIPKKYSEYFKYMAENDMEIRETMEWIKWMPDLNEKEISLQFEELDKMLKNFKPSDIK